MSQLFGDGILCILEYLTLKDSIAASQICHAWHAASQSQRRRVHTGCRIERTDVLNQAMASHLSHCLLSLDVHMLRFDGASLQRICTALPQLQMLRLDMPQAYDDDGTPTNSWCPLLLPHKLSTLTCENADPQFNDRDVAQWLVDGLPSAPGLKVLRLHQHRRVRLAPIGQLRQLTRLELMEYHNVGREDEPGLLDLLTVLSHQLTHLTLLRKLAFDQIPGLKFPLLQQPSRAFFSRDPEDIGKVTPGLWTYARPWN